MPTRDSAPGKPPESLLKRLRWNYVLGWLSLVLLAAAVGLLTPAFQGLRELLDSLVPTASLGTRIVLLGLALVFVPLGAGFGSNLLMRMFRGRRDVQAVLQFQEKLFSTVEPGVAPAYKVVLLDYPNPGVKTLGLITGTFKSVTSGQELASVFMPGTPDPSKGTIKIIPLEDVMVTEWTLEDIRDFHRTFGSVSPTSC